MKLKSIILIATLTVILMASHAVGAASFSVSDIDSGPIGSKKSSSTIIDSNGGLHTTYVKSSNRVIYSYTPDSSSNWDSSTVTTSAMNNLGKVSLGVLVSATNTYYPRVLLTDGISGSEFGSYTYATGRNNNNIFWANQLVDTYAAGTGINFSLQCSFNCTDMAATYYDSRTSDLRLARFDSNSSTWAISTIDDGGTDSVGIFNSFLINNTKYYVSYYDQTSGNLKFAYSEDYGATWSIFTVDSTNDVGADNSIALSNSGNVLISYFDLTNKKIKLAKQAATDFSSWIITDIDTSSSDTGRFSSIAVNSSTDEIHVAYYDYANNTLRHASSQDSGTTWSTTTIDVIGNILNQSSPISLVLGSDDEVFITYHDAINDSYKLAKADFSTEICDGIDNNSDGQIDEGFPLTTYYADLDNDGYGDSNTSVSACAQPANYITIGSDCNDSDSAINPGATEICDGRDNNCNGIYDDNASNANTYYTDADTDGFGNPAASMTSCVVPAGTVLDNTDCDDSNATINSNGIEICDGYDDNCDGAIDEVLSCIDVDNDGANAEVDCNDNNPTLLEATNYFEDQDGDGFGTTDSANSKTACTAPVGYVLSNNDCDDTNYNINKSSTEVCGNNIDEDCSGSDMSCTSGDTTGSDTTGGDTTGGDTTGSDTTGGDATGSDTTGGDTTGSDTTDSETANPSGVSADTSTSSGGGCQLGASTTQSPFGLMSLLSPLLLVLAVRLNKRGQV